MATQTLLTLAEFERLPNQNGERHELDEGELNTTPPTMPGHGRIVARIIARLGQHVADKRLGELFTDSGFQLSPDPATVRAPDIAFLRADRCYNVTLYQYVQGAPDLAVEVVSPSDSAHDLNRKVRQYLSSGAQAVWVVYPEEKEVHVFESASVRIVRGDDVLAAPELLPGFEVPVRELFA